MFVLPCNAALCARCVFVPTDVAAGQGLGALGCGLWGV